MQLSLLQPSPPNALAKDHTGIIYLQLHAFRLRHDSRPTLEMDLTHPTGVAKRQKAQRHASNGCDSGRDKRQLEHRLCGTDHQWDR